MTTSTVNPQRQHDSDEFAIEIKFDRHSEAPARVFRVMTDLIEAFQEIDGVLVQSVRGTLQPVTLLEDIEAGSIKAWLRNVLNAVDDESLKSGEWKKVVGGFLVRAKRIIIEWTDRKTTVTSRAEVDELRQMILDAAAETNVLAIPMYAPIPATEVARSISLVSSAIRPLRDTEKVFYLSQEAPIEINRSFEIAPETLTELLVSRSIASPPTEMILIVKRPDFLGDARWEFRHGKQPIEAKITDFEWLARFRSGLEIIMPGDALRALVISTVRYDYDGEVVDSKHEMTRIVSVIHPIRPSQGSLFTLPAGHHSPKSDPESQPPSQG